MCRRPAPPPAYPYGVVRFPMCASIYPSALGHVLVCVDWLQDLATAMEDSDSDDDIREVKKTSSSKVRYSLQLVAHPRKLIEDPNV